MSNWSVPFEFGCEYSETGLFRTQNVDGIMGMSANAQTLPYIMHSNQIITSKIFSLCLRVGGK